MHIEPTAAIPFSHLQTLLVVVDVDDVNGYVETMVVLDDSFVDEVVSIVVLNNSVDVVDGILVL